MGPQPARASEPGLAHRPKALHSRANPPFAAGVLPPNDATGARSAPPVTVIIDGIQAVVQYAGTAPGFAGLYQINVVIPFTTNIGEVTITIISSGGGPAATTPSNGFIAVQ